MVYEVEMKELAPELLASVVTKCYIEDLPRVVPEAFGRVMGVITGQGVSPTGGAVAVYRVWTEESVVVEIGFTVAAEIRAEQGVAPGRLPGGRALKTVHVGRYEDIGPAYQAMQEYAAGHELPLAKTMWERYLTDPAAEPDLSKHVTEIFWPVEEPAR
jgi:effector-binding domain-containing protein